MTMSIQQVHQHRWPSGRDEPVAILKPSIDGLARQGGFILDEWDEDGLGPARGFNCMLPSGRVVLIFELDHTRGRPVHGINLSADSQDFDVAGTTPILDEVLLAFGLSRDDVLWVAPES